MNRISGGLKTFCVIPAWNESKHLASVVREVSPFVYSVVIVDDGSTDDTYKLAKASGANVLRHFINRGQGAALRTGTEFALGNGAEIIVHFDADGQFVANEIADLIAPIIRSEAEIVFGSRFLGKQSYIPILKKVLILPLAKFINRVIFNIRTTDPQSGFRALSRKAAFAVKWRQDDMAHCSEIIYSAGKSGLAIKEVPITVIYRHFGSGFRRGFKILKDLFITRLID